MDTEPNAMLTALRAGGLTMRVQRALPLVLSESRPGGRNSTYRMGKGD